MEAMMRLAAEHELAASLLLFAVVFTSWVIVEPHEDEQ